MSDLRCVLAGVEPVACLFVGQRFGDEAEHLPCDHRPGVLVLTGHQVAVDDPVVGERVAKAGLALEVGAELAQLGLGVVRRARDAEV